MWRSAAIAASFFNPALDGGEWLSFTPWRLYLYGRTAGTHFIGDWVSHKAGLEAVEYRKSLALAGYRSAAIQSEACRYAG